MNKLSPKQQKFVDEYLIDGNATQAAMRAGYSEKTARIIGAQNLAKLNIVAAINAARNQTAKRVEITHDMITVGLLAETQKTGLGTSQGARVQAWVNLGKHIGYFAEDNAQKGAAVLAKIDDLPDAVLALVEEALIAIAGLGPLPVADQKSDASRSGPTTH